MKKVLSLLLVAILVLGMSTVSFAADKATGYAAGSPTNPELDGLTLNAGDSRAWVIPQLVTDKGPVLATPGATFMSAKSVKNAKVTVRSSLKAGSKFLDEVKIDDDGGVACLIFSIVDPFVSIDDVDFDYYFYLTFDGKRNSVEYHAEGTIEIITTEVDDADDYVDLSQGWVADVVAYVKAIEVDLGNGVIIHTKLYNGKKYFGVADVEVGDDDQALMDKYPSIDQAITLTTIGLSAAGNIVALEDYGDGYVYDKDMKYLGRANEKLPYSTKYYISSAEIVLEEEGDEPAEEGEGPEDVNDNPGTGR